MNLDTDKPVNYSSPMRAELISYVRSLKPYFIFMTCLFFLGILAGYSAASYYPEISKTMLDQFQESYGWISEESPAIVMLFIFANNTLNSFLAMILGIFFGVWSVLFILINGIFVGLVLFEFIPQYGGLVILAGLIPHGIIELPMVFLSASMGLKLGVRTFQKVFKIKDVRLKYEIFLAIRFFIIVIIPLLLIAAIIETFITAIILYGLTSGFQ